MPRPMTVGQLKDLIEFAPDDQEVYFTHDYGDRTSTITCNSAVDVDERVIVWSEYHRLYKYAEGAEEEDDGKTVLLLMHDYM